MDAQKLRLAPLFFSQRLRKKKKEKKRNSGSPEAFPTRTYAA